MGYRVAVVGATGNVGREMLNILEEVNFPVDKIHAIASRRSIGVEVSFGEQILKCEDVEQFDFSTVDVVLMSVSGSFSKEWSPKIGAAGPIVIDNSSAWRMDPDVPLIVPEVNPDDVAYAGKKNIIANPNCSTAQLVVALKPLHDRARIKRVVVSTYQSVSGAGKEGMDELWDQTKGVFVLGAPEPKKFPKQIAFNVIPFIGAFGDDGYTDEEAKMWNETHKMIDPSIALTVTCVRVPVMVGHSESVNIEFHDPLDEDEARDLLRESPGLIVIDQRNDKGYITPKEAQGEFPVFVSRIRKDPTVENGLNLWVVADNLRKGAALNAVQIAELLHERGLLKSKTAA
ncbi:aspartate-semialdehyde dehydrogenase [Phenylobacterium sp. LjRoot164]|jgi:aspartate-semialdehyde dehydrogenase|uniref:Aspartate-semialdehyde dehydrogenase n=1 Tax=Phenylobacterium haematophilum TaxID=98513 RepID=A0A839ZYS8_9CAUL|nr:MULTISPECIES: aspartate-semialdehyde dehydrogenase [Phenylobacterium]MBB3890523.1 aspartate-semialdehyde dehydrogenase [Phenylobacterium haematophilum]MBS0490193.1 aspartate-semialdehyde dehydrogenase [Pseudomonadota bacterium]MCX7588655.1 aspartate-semialdehyde dehydrogenase [Phenylobacterium sp. 58.2.17]WGU40395.1 aspartate-semialdehyde dehydrogenase [Phenylobacterium sp. NIBR 498073]